MPLTFYKNIYSLLLIFFFTKVINAQYISVDDSMTPQQMIENYLIDQSCANVSNINVSGFTFQNGDLSYGVFDANGAVFPFQEGLIITTGRAKSATGPNNSILSEGPPSWSGDADLENAINEFNTVNATFFEFDFVPLTNTISFEYVFASEQYLSNPNSNQCNFSDGFAFLLREISQTNFSNLAVVPGTNIPVKITTIRGDGTICPPANQEYFDSFNGVEHPTNYNGQTKILKAEANVTSGATYRMKLVIADQVNFRYDSAIFFGAGTFKSEINLGDNRTFANQNPLCHQESLLLDASDSGGSNFEWHKDGVLISGANQTTYTVTEPGFYEVFTNIGFCSVSGSILIEYDTEISTNPLTTEQCGFNGQAIFNLEQIANQWNLSQNYTVTFFESLSNVENNINPIQNTSNYTSGNNILYAKIVSAFGCESSQTITLTINQVNEQSYSFEFCDDQDDSVDGFISINLQNDITPTIIIDFDNNHQVVYFESLNDALLNTNPLSNNYTNNSSIDVLYAQISLNNGCLGIVSIQIEVSALYGDDFNSEITGICDTQPIFLNAPIGNNFTYVWNTGATTSSIFVEESGEFSVTVTNNLGCSNTKTFVVLDIEAPVVQSVEATSFENNHNTITINISNTNQYEFSIDGMIYQSSPIFTGLDAGKYIVYIRDKAQCFLIPIEVTISDFPRFFTPNGDGINDLWRIKNLSSNQKVIIFDRFGKIITVLTSNSMGWNGLYNNQQLPSSDYWFVLETEGIVTVKGHFSLIR